MFFNPQQIDEAILTIIIPHVDNLRNRTPKVRNDCFIRGKLAEIWFRDFFKQYGFVVDSNRIKDNGTDIDLIINGICLNNNNICFNRPIKFEIKTSLIPKENFDINNQGDFKIYKKNNDFAQDTKDWDIGIQVYFCCFKQNWEEFVNENFNENFNNQTYKQNLANLNILIFWATNGQAQEYHNALPTDKREWTFQGSHQTFWRCPLKNFNQNLYDIIIYLLQVLLSQQNDNILQLQNYIQHLNTQIN